jgi:hypothetical protein
MLGRKERRQPELFIAGTLRELLPDDHVLVRVDRVLDLGWLHEEVAELLRRRGWSAERRSRGRPSAAAGGQPSLPAFRLRGGSFGSYRSSLPQLDDPHGS